MADEGVVENFVADAILELTDRAKPGARKRLNELFVRVREIGRPPVGLALVSPEGTRYTGVALIVNGEVELLFTLTPSAQPKQDATSVVQPQQPPKRRIRRARDGATPLPSNPNDERGSE